MPQAVEAGWDYPYLLYRLALDGLRHAAPEAGIDLDQPRRRVLLPFPAEVDFGHAVPLQPREQLRADRLDRRRLHRLAQHARPALDRIRAQVVIRHRRPQLPP